MARLIPALLLVLCLAMPQPGQAQQLPSVTPDRPMSGRSDEILGISKENAFAIGAGVVVGALALHLVVPADFTYFAGGIIGGFAANWWYRNGGESQVRALLKQSNDQPAADLSEAPKTRVIALRP
jgi:hypothetical protein